MLTGPLPELVNHRKLADRREVIEGSLPTRQLRRFGGLLADSSGDVSLRLAFSRQEDGRVGVTGQMETLVALECQLCLQPVMTKLSSDLSLTIVTSEAELEQLDKGQDGIIHTDRLIPLAALVEDELLLALPMVSRHGDGECPDSDRDSGSFSGHALTGGVAAKQEEEAARTWRPFSGLAEAIARQKAEREAEQGAEQKEREI